MIELYVSVILIIFALIMASSFFSGASLFFNLVLIGLLLILLSVDLKKKHLHKFYGISLLLTGVIFILSSTPFVRTFLDLFSKASITLFTTAFILIYVLAHVSGLIAGSIETLVEQHKK